MLLGQDDIGTVTMPVSPEKILVGSTRGCALPRSFSYSVEAARASYSFFLSSCNNAEIASFCPVIAECSTFVLDEAVESDFQDSLPQNLPSRPEDDVDKPEPTYGPIDPDSREFRYELAFVGCGDQAKTQGQIDQLRAIVSALSQVLPLKRLDGITIAVDYPAALRELDRGFDNARPVETFSHEIGVGVAQMVTVIRSGEVKGRIVMSSAIMDALTSSNAPDAEFGIYAVVRALVLVAMVEFIERALPGVMLSPIEGKLNGWLYRHVDAALQAYVASYIAAGFSGELELVEAKRKLLSDAINRMRIMVLKERHSYREHGDLDELLDVTLPAIGYVLLFAADLLGHNAVAGRSAFQQSDELHISLEKARLMNWLEAYRVDLMLFHKQLGR